jgi:hypothetical protein
MEISIVARATEQYESLWRISIGEVNSELNFVVLTELAEPYIPGGTWNIHEATR